MKALLAFDNVSFVQQDVDTVNVKVTETFTVALLAAPEGLTWVASADSVLQVNDVGDHAAVTALSSGTSKVLLLDANDQPQFRLIFVVFDPLQAENMTITVGDPERK